MNIEHFKAFVWLRWRIRINQLKRGGLGNKIVLGILAVSIVFSSIGLFFGGISVGAFALANVKPSVLMYVWDGIVVSFLFFWMIGLMTELQRTDSLSLDKFLHFPVSLRSAFLINYFSSLAGLSMIVYVPMICGLSLGLTFSRGVEMIFVLPMAISFLFVVSAITYQFQGWLASMMSNPRKRRTVIGIVTISFVMVAQLPNLINIVRPFGTSDNKFETNLMNERNELLVQLQSQKITPDEHTRKSKDLEDNAQKQREENKLKFVEEIETISMYANLVLPPGWLPLGVKKLAEGSPWALLGGMSAFSLVGFLSLWRAYRTTLRLYTGYYNTGTSAVVAKDQARKPAEKYDSTKLRLVEYEVAWLPEQTAGIAFGSFRALTRAPEAKMLLLMPLIFGVIFGGLFFSHSEKIPDFARPFTAIGALAMMMFSLQQLIANQFGYDRGGFRAFVLGPVPRNQILIGKNLAVFPFAAGFCLLAVIGIEVIMPMRLDHFLGAILHIVPMYLGMCLIANMLAIFAPIAIAAGSTKASNVKFLPVMLHLLGTMFLPLAFLPAVIPIGIEVALDQSELLTGIPLALGLDVLVAVGSVFVYRWILKWQGEILQNREQKILEIVTSKSE